jgi:hypothetical protein
MIECMTTTEKIGVRRTIRNPFNSKLILMEVEGVCARACVYYFVKMEWLQIFVSFNLG